jgi:4-diphosphocytidyl-2-C-methyl-D-erythritol kinase
VATQAQLTLLSPAKINVYLRVLAKRADGYHDLDTVMLPLDFGDEITLQLQPNDITLECDDPRLPTDDSNLALRAARLLSERHGNGRGAKITLTKRIPLAAGLGGGSGNAATVLLGLKQLWKLDVPLSTLDEIAASMGSDINFFLRGGAAACRGRGERVESIACKLSAAILLVNPGFGISTKWAYESWAKAASALTVKPPEVSLLLRALAGGNLADLSATLFNSLEAPSVRKFPVLRLLKDALRVDRATGALMSGSGATVFGLFAEVGQAERSAQRIREQFGPSMWTHVAHFSQTCLQ